MYWDKGSTPSSHGRPQRDTGRCSPMGPRCPAQGRRPSGTEERGAGVYAGAHDTQAPADLSTKAQI